jgi:3-phenylpropionate/trans-cinnamate dioxygenase ferredoxin subunit
MRENDRRVQVCSLDRLTSKGMVAIRAAGVDLVLLCDEGRVVACERACPHEQADLAAGRVAQGRLFCPRHAASFGLRDGAISPGWPSRGLRLYPVQVEDGKVLVDVAALQRK